MADEVVAVVVPGKIDYTMKHYMTYLKGVRDISEKLEKEGSYVSSCLGSTLFVLSCCVQLEHLKSCTLSASCR